MSCCESRRVHASSHSADLLQTTLLVCIAFENLPCEQRFIACMAFSVYHVVRAACL